MADNKKNKNNDNYTSLPIGMCSGLSIGMMIGVIMDNIPICMCIGLALGTCFGAVFSTSKKEKNDTAGNETDKEDK
ncbi:MAG: hypothetical protein IKW87_02850 [Ruminococcus sp.]|nr:hypothetical protein [Ruminococcus sp.]